MTSPKMSVTRFSGGDRGLALCSECAPDPANQGSGALIRRCASAQSSAGVSLSAGTVQNWNVAVFAHGRTCLMIVRCGSVRANVSSAALSVQADSVQ
jgi:hypothetical protein